MAKSQFIDQIRTEMRTRHYSIRTEKTYIYWIRFFIIFNDKKHPESMGNREIERFLNHIAVNRKVSAATQNQALCSIIFLYRYFIKREITDLNYSFAKRPRNLPTTLSPSEVSCILGNQTGKYKLITALLYGCGLRIHEALSLRIKDIDLYNQSSLFSEARGAKIGTHYCHSHCSQI